MTEATMFAQIPFAVVDLMKLQNDGTSHMGSKAVLLYVAMARRANFDTGEFYATRKTLAKDIGLKKAAAVDDPIDELQAAGLLTVHRKWKDKGNPPTYSRIEDERFCIPTASDYVLHRAPGTPGLRTSPSADDPLPATLDVTCADEVFEWISEQVGGDLHETTILGILGSSNYTAEEAARVALKSAKKWNREGPGSLTTPASGHAWQE